MDLPYVPTYYFGGEVPVQEWNDLRSGIISDGMRARLAVDPAIAGPGPAPRVAPKSNEARNNRVPSGSKRAVYIDLTLSDDDHDSQNAAPKRQCIRNEGFNQPPLRDQVQLEDFRTKTQPMVPSFKENDQPGPPLIDEKSEKMGDMYFVPPNLEDAIEDEESEIILTPAQQAVVEMAVAGHSIFLTGAAGSGKTATLKEIQRRLRRKYLGKKGELHPQIQVVAPTGIAALPLNGKTTYSFAGWNPDSFQKPMTELLEYVPQYVAKAMKALKVLIVEEISMVEGQFLNRMNTLMKHVLQSAQPFGGKQIIFLGDFHQIPPVKPLQFCVECGESMKKPEIEPACGNAACQESGKVLPLSAKWAFKSAAWDELNLRHFKLEQIHRQKDLSFQDVLNKIRNGISLDPDEWKALTAKKILPARAFAVRLMSLKRRVDDFNGRQLSSINSKPNQWEALDTAGKLFRAESDQLRHNDIEKNIKTHRDALKTYHMFPNGLTLKVGAKVVLLTNLSPKNGLVNGSQGEVVHFVDTTNWPSGDSIEAQKGKSARQMRQDDAIEEFIQTRGGICPVVRFTNGCTKTIRPAARESLKGTSQDRYYVCRTQIPLTLAWALSIHKSQGMTLEHVELLSEDIFESGQLYVGMSRATTLGGLTVTGYSRNLLAVDPDVLDFYKRTGWEDLGEEKS